MLNAGESLGGKLDIYVLGRGYKPMGNKVEVLEQGHAAAEEVRHRNKQAWTIDGAETKTPKSMHVGIEDAEGILSPQIRVGADVERCGGRKLEATLRPVIVTVHSDVDLPPERWRRDQDVAPAATYQHEALPAHVKRAVVPDSRLETPQRSLGRFLKCEEDWHEELVGEVVDGRRRLFELPTRMSYPFEDCPIC